MKITALAVGVAVLTVFVWFVIRFLKGVSDDNHVLKRDGHVKDKFWSDPKR